MGLIKVSQVELQSLDGISGSIVTQLAAKASTTDVTTGLAGKMSKLADLTPVNAVNAIGTLTFTGVVSDGETVTIGARVYEFDTDSSVTGGNIAVDVSGGATAAEAVTALVAAITADGTATVTAVDGADDTVVVTAKIAGTAANATATTKTCANASWGTVTLAGGVNGTVASEAGVWGIDATYLYFSVAANTVADKNWRRVSLGTAY